MRSELNDAHDLILAVDGGQTSTKAIIARRDGTILGTGRGTPCDHVHGPDGIRKNREAIHSAANAALLDAGVPADRILGVGLGLTSAPREAEATPIFRGIVDELCTPDAFWVDTDFVSNLAGAAAGGTGIVVIAGGGSIGYGIDEHGHEAVAGGLGYLMGDDGSGWYFGMRALQEAARAYDKRGPMTALLPFVLAHYDLTQIRDIIRIIYADGFTRERIATIATDVIRIAEEGDPVAAEIVAEGARRLGETALGVARQLHAAGDPVRVYPTGGIFDAGEIILTPFAEEIRAGWPAATIETPRFPPVVGALIAVWKTLGDEIDETRLANITRSLSR